MLMPACNNAHLLMPMPNINSLLELFWATECTCSLVLHNAPSGKEGRKVNERGRGSECFAEPEVGLNTGAQRVPPPEPHRRGRSMLRTALLKTR
jgi:hypothetical protein